MNTKHLEKIQHPFIIKTLNIRNRRELLTFLKSIYEKPTADIILNEERQCFSH